LGSESGGAGKRSPSIKIRRYLVASIDVAVAELDFCSAAVRDDDGCLADSAPVVHASIVANSINFSTLDLCKPDILSTSIKWYSLGDRS
jgi:hypothetical protein